MTCDATILLSAGRAPERPASLPPGAARTPAPPHPLRGLAGSALLRAQRTPGAIPFLSFTECLLTDSYR